VSSDKGVRNLFHVKESGRKLTMSMRLVAAAKATLATSRRLGGVKCLKVRELAVRLRGARSVSDHE
jgi:hypothetical protein